MKTTRIPAIAAAVAAGATLPALASAASDSAPAPRAAAAATTVVTLKDISFRRSVVRIARGDSVRWRWADGDIPHNVTFAKRHSTSRKSGTYVLRFTAAGTFRYRCTLHPGMEGKVVVR
jgi:plastocyanin